MTTVAWDGETLAADTHSEATVNMTVHKIHRLANGDLFAGAGLLQEVLAVLAWLEGREKPGGLQNFEGLIITEFGAERIGDRLMRVPCLEPFCAVGSGAPFAIAAMACGKNSADAVRIAVRFDPYSGGEVETERRKQ